MVLLEIQVYSCLGFYADTGMVMSIMPALAVKGELNWACFLQHGQGSNFLDDDI